MVGNFFQSLEGGFFVESGLWLWLENLWFLWIRFLLRMGVIFVCAGRVVVQTIPGVFDGDNG
jgi:hypothetical protein